MQAQDVPDEVRDPGSRATELTEEPPGPEGGKGLLDAGTDLRMGSVDGLLACWPVESISHRRR